jgi:hypothetical protein
MDRRFVGDDGGCNNGYAGDWSRRQQQKHTSRMQRARHLPNLSSPQHVTLPPTSARRVELPLLLLTACLDVVVATAQACWSPTEILAT